MIVIDWWTPKQLEEKVGITIRNQHRLRQEKLIPYSKLGRLVRYNSNAINQWLENHSVVGL